MEKPSQERLPRQNTLFNLHEMPSAHWVWVVEFRLQHPVQYKVMTFFQWSEWGAVPRPNHFRDEDAANYRVKEMKETMKRPVELGVIEYRVVPKYVGYIPDKDEAWLS